MGTRLRIGFRVIDKLALAKQFLVVARPPSIGSGGNVSIGAQIFEGLHLVSRKIPGIHDGLLKPVARLLDGLHRGNDFLHIIGVRGDDGPDDHAILCIDHDLRVVGLLQSLGFRDHDMRLGIRKIDLGRLRQLRIGGMILGPLGL